MGSQKVYDEKVCALFGTFVSDRRGKALNLQMVPFACMYRIKFIVKRLSVAGDATEQFLTYWPSK